MTGPDHFREAEALLDSAYTLPRSPDGAIDPLADHLIAQALVHATLAQAAATACNPSGTGEVTVSGGEEWAAWRDVCGVKLNPAAAA